MSWLKERVRELVIVALLLLLTALLFDRRGKTVQSDLITSVILANSQLNGLKVRTEQMVNQQGDAQLKRVFAQLGYSIVFTEVKVDSTE